MFYRTHASGSFCFFFFGGEESDLDTFWKRLVAGSGTSLMFGISKKFSVEIGYSLPFPFSS